MSGIIDSLSAVVEVDERTAELRRQEARQVEKVRKRAERWRVELAAWEQGAVEDELAGKDAKPRPEQPDETVSQQVLDTIRQQLREATRQRFRVIVGSGPEIVQQVDAAVDEILSEAVPVVAILGDLLTRLRGAVGALDDLRGARHMLDPSGRIDDRPHRPVDLSALLEAVEHGSGVLLEGRTEPGPRLGLIVARSATSDAAPEPDRGDPPGTRRVRLSDGREVVQQTTTGGARP